MAINFAAASTAGLNNPGTEIITLVKDGGGNFINPPSYDKMRTYLSSGEVPMLFVTAEGGKTGSLYQLVEYSETENKISFSNDKTTIAFSAGAVTPAVSNVVPKPLTYDYMPEGYPSKAVQATTLMAEQEVAFSLMGNAGPYAAVLPSPLEIVGGQTYTVNWDGTEYECAGIGDDSYPILGNLSIIGEGDDTGEPFIFIPAEGNVVATFDTSASHSISVKRTEEIVTPMSEKFLPANLATKSDVEVVQTTAENAQTTADKNKEVLAGAFSSVATFTFDKQISGRDTFVFNTFDYYKISDFNPSPSDVFSFKGTRENGDEFSEIDTGNNCVQYGLFIVVASAGVCSIPNVSHTLSFTAPSAGLYARYGADNSSMTAGTAEFTLRNPNGNYIAGLFLRSSTTGSTKKFKITVDDSGTISATEVT